MESIDPGICKMQLLQAGGLYIQVVLIQQDRLYMECTDLSHGSFKLSSYSFY